MSLCLDAQHRRTNVDYRTLRICAPDVQCAARSGVLSLPQIHCPIGIPEPALDLSRRDVNRMGIRSCLSGMSKRSVANKEDAFTTPLAALSIAHQSETIRLI